MDEHDRNPLDSGEIIVRRILAGAIADHPSDTRPVLALGVRYENTGEFESALELYEAYSSIDALAANVVFARLNALTRLGRLSEANSVFENLPELVAQQVLTSHNSSVLLKSMIASGALEKKDFDEKSVFFERSFLRDVSSIAETAREFSNRFHIQYTKIIRDYAAAAGAHFLYVSVDDLFSVRNKSATERELLTSRIWENWANRSAWLKTRPPHLDAIFRDQPEYSQEYIDQIFTGPSHILQATKVALPNYNTDYVNIVNNMRVTTGKPETPQHRVLMLGGSDVYGFGSDDANTIPSHLQARLNEINGPVFAVDNHGLRGNPLAVCVNNLLQTHIREGDILILFGYPRLPEEIVQELGIQTHHVSFSRPHDYGELFFDQSHLGPRGNAIVAEQLAGLVQKQVTAHVAKRDFDEKFLHGSIRFLKYLLYRQASETAEAGVLKEYISYLRPYHVEVPGLIGSVAVNCNPMTLGHLHLLEHAANNVDHLFVFVIEEDLSFFPFKERLEVVSKGLAHLNNVTVLRGGRFICTQLTFPEYFSKDDVSQARADASMEAWFFCEYVAPALGITRIFLGEEPKCVVTSQYNAKMQEILPTYGIDVEIIPRIKKGGEPISASAVRRFLSEKDFDSISQIVPKVTLGYLVEKYS